MPGYAARAVVGSPERISITGICPIAMTSLRAGRLCLSGLVCIIPAFSFKTPGASLIISSTAGIICPCGRKERRPLGRLIYD